MSTGPGFEIKEQIRHAIDIVDLVGQHIPLRREGKLYKGLCPWHADSRPSLQVNPERQSFKCWVCDIGGDIFAFTMKIEGVQFPEALAMLAQRAGIPLEQRRGPAAQAAVDEKKRLYDAMAWAESEYHEYLASAPEAEVARRYLVDRGITDDSLHRFHLGFAPNRSTFLLERNRGQFDVKLLETAGLVSRRDDQSGHYERFRGRVLFSIRDSQGRPVGLGGRVLPESGSTSPAKYVNSPETPLFKKSELLYGLDLARDAISKSRTALVTEGYTDCIVAHQFGFANTLAVLGTALGEAHIKLLRRYGAERVVLVLDGDEAGQKRTNEVLDLFVAERVDLRILTLPEELDPCEFLLERGAAEFQALVDQAVDALDHRFRLATQRVAGADATHHLTQAVEEVLTTLAKGAGDGGGSAAKVREDQILHRLARLLAPGGNITAAEERLRGRLSTLRRQASQRSPYRPQTPPAEDAESSNSTRETLDPLERSLLEIVLLGPETFPRFREALREAEIFSGLARQLWRRAGELWDAGLPPTFDRLLLEFDDPMVKNLLIELDERSRVRAGGPIDALAAEWIASFERRREERALAEQRAVLTQRTLSADEELALLERMVQQRRSRQSISAPTEG